MMPRAFTSNINTPMNNSLQTIAALVGIFTLSISLPAAAFDSGSDGSDGPLHIVLGYGEYLNFDPDHPQFHNADTPPEGLDADRDGIYHFTTITIEQGAALFLGGDVMGHKPVIWLASGDVTIDGRLSVSAGSPSGTYPSTATIPGAGGFAGGQPDGIIDGQGPGGSQAGSGQGPSDDYVNSYLIPLIGGSGAGLDTGNIYAASSGGGALLLASSSQIVINGEIDAYGSDGANGNGNVRLIANEISGSGVLRGINILRMEAYQHSFNGTINLYNEPGKTVRTRPGNVFQESPIKITIIEGNNGPYVVSDLNPGANKDAPDVTINEGGEVTIQVECTNIPLGTTIRVVGWNDTVGQVEAVTGGLTGTLAASEATCVMVIPTGNTTFMAQALP